MEQCKQSRAGRPKSDTIYDITDGGEVSTDEIRPADVDYRMKDEVFVRFNTKFSEPPAVIMGLKYLRIRGKETHGITGTIQPVHDHLFGLCAKASEDSEYKGGFTWLAVPSYEHPLLQVGTESTTRDPGWARTVDMSWTKLSKKITFQSPYDLRPRVVIWLTHIECNPGEDEDVKTVAIKITPTGFTAKILAWGHIDMYNFGISWFAYPLDTPGIRSGNAYLTDGTMGVVSFNEPFSNTPRRVLVGLNSFYIPNHDVSTCIDIIYEAVSERGMGVRVENHENSKIKSAGVAYIAME